MHIWTQPLEPETAFSTVMCELAESNGSGIESVPIEPLVRFRWRTNGTRLLALYGP